MARSSGFILSGCLASLALGGLTARAEPSRGHAAAAVACGVTTAFRQAQADFNQGKALFARKRYAAADQILHKGIVAISDIYWRAWQNTPYFDDSGDAAAYGQRLEGHFRSAALLDMESLESQLDLCAHPPPSWDHR